MYTHRHGITLIIARLWSFMYNNTKLVTLSHVSDFFVTMTRFQKSIFHKSSLKIFIYWMWSNFLGHHQPLRIAIYNRKMLIWLLNYIEFFLSMSFKLHNRNCQSPDSNLAFKMRGMHSPNWSNLASTLNENKPPN